MSKSYVTIEQKICPVCGKEHDSGTILLDRRLKNTFERNTITGWALCDEHQQQFDDGYVFLIGSDTKKSKLNHNGTVSLENAHRTGEVASIKKDVAKRIFNIDIPGNGLMFCDPKVIKTLQEKVNNV